MSSFPAPPSAVRPNTPPRIAIIGGGITGLAAAHRLTELLPTPQITLFEASHRLGGVLETIERGGFLIERSADSFLCQPTAAVDLCRRLGIAGELLPTDASQRRARVVRDGELLPIPSGFHLMSPRRLTSVLTSPVLSLAGKLRLLAECLVPPRAPSPFGRGQGESADESVASFATRRLGREVFERLIQPLVAGIYTADPARLSMAATMPQFLEFERQHGSLLCATLRRSLPSEEDRNESEVGDAASGARYGLFVAPRGGMSSLISALARKLPSDVICLNTPISSIARQSDGRWHLSFSPPCSAFRPPPSFDALIVAAPAHAAAKLLQEFDSDLAANLAGIEYAGCAVVSLGFERRQLNQPLDGFGFVVPQIENRPIIAANFASRKFAGRAPAGAVLIRVFVGGALQPDLLRLDDDGLRRLALDQLADLLHIIGMPLMSDVARWSGSMPQYHVGHLARVARIEQRANMHTGLALAGNAYHGVGIPQCIASGQSAAERVAAQFIEI